MGKEWQTQWRWDQNFNNMIFAIYCANIKQNAKETHNVSMRESIKKLDFRAQP